MLSIGKLGQGQERYYLEAVAEGAEDYYVYAGEAPGRWSGGGSASLGLAGDVQGEAFTAVLRAAHPVTGEALGQRNAASKVPGFDLTFSAPKSVSLLFALGDDLLSRRMRDAHDAAVADALGYLERTAGHGRRGHAGAERIATTGFVAAVFRHRTSRAGDPNLHSHCVIANRVLGADGRWSALDAKAIYAQAKTAGTLYEASLRHELDDLGLSWTVAHTGLAEIEGVPHAVRRAFSQRRQQIEQHLTEHGLSSARAAQVATLETRAKKDHAVDSDTLYARWRDRAAELGFTPDVIGELVREGQERLARGAPGQDVDLAGRLLGPMGLTERSSSFGQREVLRAVANALPDGASVAKVEQLAAALLESSEVVALSAGEMQLRGQDVMRVRRAGAPTQLVPFGASERRFSTGDLLALEQQLVATAVGGRGATSVPAEEGAVDAALARRPALNAEQRRMVKRLALSGDRVDVVNAAAGSGKTTALDAVSEAFTASGRSILGASLSAKAAGVLRDETGMATFTVTRLLLDLRNPRSGGLPSGAIVVIDEAGQVGTRALAELEHHVRQADGKLILVGDLHQLPEIDAGGAFRGLVNRLEVVEMTSNHRQRDAGDRARLRELRSGDVRAAMASYDEAGRITRAGTSDELRELLVGDWANAFVAAEGGSVVMLGLTNHDVDDLNERAREHLVAAGRLGPVEVLVGDRGYRVGDHVVTRHNDYRLGVLNGQRWVVSDVDEAARVLVLRGLSHETLVQLPFEYAQVGRDRLQHGYALTTSLSQGSTVDRAFVLGSDATYREAGYTAASRAREATRFYVVSRDDADDCVEQHGGPRVTMEEQDPLREMTRALERSGAQHLALDTPARFEPRYVGSAPEAGDRTRDAERPALARALAGGPSDPTRLLERVQRQLREAQDELARAAADRTHADEAVKSSSRLTRRHARHHACERLASALEREDVWARRVEQLVEDEERLQRAAGEFEAWRETHSAEISRLSELAEIRERRGLLDPLRRRHDPTDAWAVGR